MTDDEIRTLVDDPALRSGVPAVELAEAFLERLERAQTMHAMTTITPELALAQAREVDARRSRGQRLPLDGMPIVVKDNIDVAGVPTTVGSRLFADRTPTEDAEVTLRLREAGAVILGKANMHELAFGATSANEAFGAVVNPAAPDRIPGGSSGGSGSSRRRRPLSSGDRDGHRGLRPAAGVGLRRVGDSADVRRRVEPGRTAGVCLAGHRRCAGARGRRRALAARRRCRVRPGRSDVPPPSARARWRRRPEAACASASSRPWSTAADPAVASCVGSFVERARRARRDALEGGASGVGGRGRGLWPPDRGEALAVYGEALASRPELLEEGTRRRLALASDLEHGRPREP